MVRIFNAKRVCRKKPARPKAQQKVGGAGFEPAKAEPTDLQSVPFDRFGTPPFLFDSGFAKLNRPLSESIRFLRVKVRYRRKL